MPELITLIPKTNAFGFTDAKGGTVFELEVVDGIKHSWTSDMPEDDGKKKSSKSQIFNNPAKLSMKCQISNKRPKYYNELSSLALKAVPPNPLAQELASKQTYKISNLLLDNSETRRQDYFNKLEEMWKKKIPFNVVTGLKVYVNMFFSSITIDEDKTTENSLVFDCSVEEFNFKSKQTGAKSIGADGASTESTSNLGSQKQKPVNEEKSQSVLFKLSKYAGGE